MDSSIIYKHFPELDDRQRSQIDMLGDLYADWNAKINVISRKDIDNLYPNHVLHSLALARVLGTLPAGATMMDLGTGGGFPGIPLAIAYPQCRFHLVDRIGKKIRVAQEVARVIGLENVTFQHGDAGECHERFNYVVSRAVMDLSDLVPIAMKNVAKTSLSRALPNGLLCLKGGDIYAESEGIKKPVDIIPLAELIDEPHFSGKYAVYVKL